MRGMPLAEQAKESARRLALELKALLRDSGQPALAVSRSLGRAPEYLTRVFNGRVELKMKDAFGILQALAVNPGAFFESHFRSANGGQAARGEAKTESRAGGSTVDELLIPALDARQEAPHELLASTRAALRRRIVAAGANQRAVSRDLGLPRDALGQALRDGTDLTAWHVFGVLMATETPAEAFFREVVARPAVEQRRPKFAPTPSELASHPGSEATGYGDFVRLSPEGKVAWLSHHPEGAAFFTCRDLIEKSEAVRDSDSAAMLAMSRAAVACAEAFPASGELHALADDIRAEAWASLSNALKVRGLLREAEGASSNAQLHLASGSGDPLLKAKLLWLKGSLRIEQRRLRQAIELLDEARRLYISINDRQAEAKTLLTLGRAYWMADRIEDAIACVFSAARRADSERDPLLKVHAFQNLAGYLEAAGQPRLALAILERTDALFEESAGPLLKLRKRWVEGRLLARVDRLGEAITILDSVRQRFTDLGMAFDAALAALDLATFYAQLGKLHEVEELATEMYPVFVSRDIPREATAALLLFAEAARAHTATVASITEVAERLKKIQSRKG